MSRAAHARNINTVAPEAHLRKLLDVKARAEAPAAAGDHDGCHIGAVVGLARVVGQGRQHCNQRQMGQQMSMKVGNPGQVSAQMEMPPLHGRAGQLGSTCLLKQQSAQDWSGG